MMMMKMMMMIGRRSLSSSKSELKNPSSVLLSLFSTSSSSLPKPHPTSTIPCSSPSSKQPPFPPPPPPPPSLPLTRDGNYDDATPPSAVCPGCGVHMQDSNPKLPGFFTKPSSPKDQNFKPGPHLRPVSMSEPVLSDSLKRGLLAPGPDQEPDPGLTRNPGGKPVVCARCFSLRHYGKVKDSAAENLLPEFDFFHTVGRRLMSSGGARTVVLLVVDAADFDGSFPKKVAKMVSGAVEEKDGDWKQGKSGNVARIVLVVTKIDLLPASLSPTGFEYWIRQRARENGCATGVDRVHLVSAVRNWGVKELVENVIELAGPRGNVWAVGTQNVGKSTLLNAMAACAGEGGGEGEGEGESVGKVSFLTEAPVPGTTLGIVRVEGVLPGRAKLFDTPGLLNPCQITTRLTRDEQKLVHVSKELKPRTYRIKEGYSIHIGGLIRLDIEDLSVDSVYVTVWASPYLPLHMGKTENASTMWEDHFGRQLQPPIGENRFKELGNWVRRQFRVSGKSWNSSAADIAAAGVGWFAIGLKGEAILSAWTYEGVDVVVRNSLILHRAQTFEVAGFTVSKIVSKADEALNKSQPQSRKKRKQSDQRVAPLAESLSSVGVAEKILAEL